MVRITFSCNIAYKLLKMNDIPVVFMKGKKLKTLRIIWILKYIRTSVGTFEYAARESFTFWESAFTWLKFLKSDKLLFKGLFHRKSF